MTAPHPQPPEAFFSYSPELGYETHHTEAEAIASAESALDDARDSAGDDLGWPDGTTQICWGRIAQSVKRISSVPRPPDDQIDGEGEDADGRQWGDFATIDDYGLETRTPPAPAPNADTQSYESLRQERNDLTDEVRDLKDQVRALTSMVANPAPAPGSAAALERVRKLLHWLDDDFAMYQGDDGSRKPAKLRERVSEARRLMEGVLGIGRKEYHGAWNLADEPTSAASARAAAKAATDIVWFRFFDGDDDPEHPMRKELTECITSCLAPFFPAAPGWTTVSDDPATWPPDDDKPVLLICWGNVAGEYEAMQPGRIARTNASCGAFHLRRWHPWPSTPEARP